MSDGCNLDRLAWVDLETSGLHRERCTILEVGIIVTDRQLTEVARAAWLVKPWPHFHAEPGAMAMHARSGLLSEVQIGGQSRADVENFAMAFIKKHEAVLSPMCGAGVAFDRHFLHREMPSLAELFHYRNFDVSVFRIAAELTGREVPEKREHHRALADLEDAIALARIALAWGKP